VPNDSITSLLAGRAETPQPEFAKEADHVRAALSAPRHGQEAAIRAAGLASRSPTRVGLIHRGSPRQESA